MNPALADDKKALWAAVMDGEVKQQNSQMDVVVALWGKGLIECPLSEEKKPQGD